MAQRNTIVAGAAAYPALTPAAYAARAGAWPPTNLSNASLYANPGYAVLASRLRWPAQPTSYDYGSNVVVQSDAVYVNGDSAGTPEEYAAQAGQIAESGAAAPPADASWHPLGVFAMVEPGQTESNDIFQLAINDQGAIRGNYENKQTQETTPLAGAVDPKTLRAAWTIGGDKAPVYEAGIANLSKEQTTMLFHTPDGQQKQFALIRLPDPAGSEGGNAAAPQ